MQQRDSMQFDVVIVGAGPAGLSAAIKLKQLASAQNQEISICIVEKGAEVGAHSLSGAVLDPVALNELIPDWESKKAPVNCSVVKDNVLYLTQSRSFKLPVPPSMHNHGNYIISLGQLSKWLAAQAEELGVEIYPGFAAAEVLYHADGSVKGIATGDMGRDKNGEETPNFQPGMELHARQTIFAEGAHGSLTKEVIQTFQLDKNVQKQVYGLGVKEIWQADPSVCMAGKVVHTLGWPMDNKTYGGSFMYHMGGNKIAIGFVIGLDYQNPYLSPFEEFQRFKTHPAVSPFLKNGKRLEYGARVLSEGGVQCMPKLTFAGGVLVGDAAGFVNVPKIKGIHSSMKSGMLVAECIYQSLQGHDAESDQSVEISGLDESLKSSWLYKELWAVRNVRPTFKWGALVGAAYAGLEEYILRGKAPWTIKHAHADHESLKLAAQSNLITYPKPDGVLTFDIASSVYLSGTHHEENQPCHLQLKNPEVAIDVNYAQFAAPETKYCPAGVYEIVMENEQPKLQINASNCLHCKTCDIKDSTQNINWVCPEGGGGPNYSEM